MAEAVATDDLTTLERAKRHLEISEGESKRDPFIISLIGSASGWVREFTGQPIRQRAVSWSVTGEGLIEGDGSNTVILPAFPVLCLSALEVDARVAGPSWGWDNSAHVETGDLRYGVTSGKHFTLNQRRGTITLTDGSVFPEGPFVRVDAVVGLADGTTASPLPLHASYPFSATLFSAANNGGKTHNVFGWEGPRGDAIQQKVNELVAWQYRQAERASQGMAAQSGGGSTITYLDNVPREIRDFFEQWRRTL